MKQAPTKEQFFYMHFFTKRQIEILRLALWNLDEIPKQLHKVTKKEIQSLTKELK